MEQKKLLSIREAAELAGLTEGLIRSAVKQEQIPSVRVGRLIRIPRKAFERLLDEGRADD